MLVVLAASVTKAQDIPAELYGTWINGEGQVLKVNYDNTFTRYTKSEIISQGVIETKDGMLHIVKENEEYDLGFYVGSVTFVATKPNDKTRAWIFNKIQ